MWNWFSVCFFFAQGPPLYSFTYVSKYSCPSTRLRDSSDLTQGLWHTPPPCFSPPPKRHTSPFKCGGKWRTLTTLLYRKDLMHRAEPNKDASVLFWPLLERTTGRRSFNKTDQIGWPTEHTYTSLHGKMVYSIGQRDFMMQKRESARVSHWHSHWFALTQQLQDISMKLAV